MNFLAHLLASGNKEGVLIGNFAGDFVKGKLTEAKTKRWNQDFVFGLKLHRHIDFYTDHHPVVVETRKVLSEKYGRLSGIILDIYFDYFLGKNFNQFSVAPLDQYAKEVYATIRLNEYLIPYAMIPMTRAMIKQDWLTSYASHEGINLTFRRLSKRAPFLTPLEYASEELVGNEEYYLQQFIEFFPDFIQETSAFLGNRR